MAHLDPRDYIDEGDVDHKVAFSSIGDMIYDEDSDRDYHKVIICSCGSVYRDTKHLGNKIHQDERGRGNYEVSICNDCGREQPGVVGYECNSCGHTEKINDDWIKPDERKNMTKKPTWI